MKTLLIACLAPMSVLLLAGCPERVIVPLVGEDAEVRQLLGVTDDGQAGATALTSARRLYQGMVQHDTELVWSLLAPATQTHFDSKGAVLGTTGRELLEAQSLPTRTGSTRRVRFERILFGEDVIELTEGPMDTSAAPPSQTIYAVTASGAVKELRFVQLEGAWRLLDTAF